MRTLSGFLLLSLGMAAHGAETPSIDFTREIRPILNNSCFTCHGPDEATRKAKLRIDVREEAIKKSIIPGNGKESPLYQRMISTDADTVMPPAHAKKPAINAAQAELVRKWIDAGAKYDEHWAFAKPVRVEAPMVKNQAWVKNAIDAFIAKGHEKQGFTAAPPADKITFIRRVCMDLTGLPPTPAMVEKYLNDTSATADASLLDELLASPSYGERMAVMWLDAIRYADTAGYHSDNHRDIWMFRDYVIQSFIQNKPFDVFTTEQLAGDLLPNATKDQRVASGYNRMLMTTEEGGAQAKEYTAKYLADRVRNASNAWLGTTLGCAECHNHKYDPFTTKDFYRFGAFFADVAETAVGRQQQTRIMSPEQEAQVKKADEAITKAKEAITAVKLNEQAFAKWMNDLSSVVKSLPKPVIDVLLIDAGKRNEAQKKIIVEHYRRLTKPTLSVFKVNDALVGKWADALGSKWADEATKILKGVPKPIIDIVLIDAAKRNETQKQALTDHYRTFAPETDAARKAVVAATQAKDQLITTFPQTLITTSTTPRMVRILPRGNWQDDSGEQVTPGVPGFLAIASIPEKKAPDRLSRTDLAKWIVAPENPLTARVFVNRLWKIAFGQGLVRNMDDFGTQGTPPSHPELLDWLATEFIRTKWDVKAMLKLMLMSNTYRQSSLADKKLRDQDPSNIWLARQNRFRIDAEFIRDQALAVSGLLNRKLGGPSVNPYQPAGYWSYLNFPRREWQNSTTDEQYRRGLYTYWCRSFPHPSLSAFDAPSREECTNERTRSSTPLQALVLLNDPTYVEAAKKFAERIMTDGGKTTAERLNFAFKQALSRPAKATEVNLLEEMLAKHIAEFKGNQDAAAKLLKTGYSPIPKMADNAELAAWTSISRVILNLHEAVTRN